MLQHAFRFVSHVVFIVSPDNVRSQRAVEKIGGVMTGMRPDAGGEMSHIYQISDDTSAGEDGVI